MKLKRAVTGLALLFLSSSALAQTQTTGRISGTVQDQRGALIVGARVTIISQSTGEQRQATSDAAGNFAVAGLQPGVYHARIEANGFNNSNENAVTVNITETTPLKAILTVTGPVVDPVVINDAAPLIRTDGPELGRAIDARTVADLPLGTRNFTQLLALSPGVSVYLPDSTSVGRNSQNVSVNGSRVTQNNFQINGIDANAGISRSVSLAAPAPETIQEFKVQSSLYDATFGRAGGGNIQIVTKSGTNDLHGVAYEYFGNDALNANNPFLKAVGARRPVLKRNIFGATIGGPIRKDKAFFFGSYQGTRERNGASRLNSLSVNVLVDPRLTSDRSDAALHAAFGPSIHPVALALLNARSASGEFLIPTPQANGRYSGSSISVFREDQFNANMDYRINQKNWLAMKFFFSNAPQTLALSGAANVPGIPVDGVNNNRLLSIQDIHIFNSNITNEARIGYNFIRADTFTRQPLKDSAVGITRSTASDFPGLPLIQIALNAGGIQLGTSALQDVQSTLPSATFADTLSITHGPHSIRAGAELRYYEANFNAPVLTRGSITFPNFNSFLIGQNFFSVITNGITERNLRTNDYDFFIQDDWKISSRLTLNLGLRYELDLPPYDRDGRMATFDPALYKARPLFVVVNGAPTPVGPPIGGFVQAGNAIPQYDLAEVPNVGKRVVRSIDPNNFAPRVGFAYSPLQSSRLVLRGGYGIFYSRTSFTSVNNSLFSPPFYLLASQSSPPATLNDPFPSIVSQSPFPAVVQGVPLSGLTFDRNMRTPYVQQYNVSLQTEISKDMILEAAYVGTRGLNLLRQVAINQARLASGQHPIVNEVTGAAIITNTPANAGLRAPFQGVATNGGQAGFVQDQTTAQSSYNSLQLSFTRRFSRGLQIQASYTYSKSIDNASGQGGGAGTTGLIDAGAAGETSGIVGDQSNNRANRGVSNFDRTHRLVLSYLWELPKPEFVNHSSSGRLLFANWQIAGIITAMSGLPIDIVDSNAGSFYGMNGAGAGGRPNWAPGATRSTATSSIPPGYFFNPLAFSRPTVLAGQLIPSSNGTATASTTGTDFGNVERNVLRGPRQTNVDFSISKRFPFGESKSIEFRADVFNMFNQVNFANPISNLNAIPSSGINSTTGQIISPGDFGRIISTSNNPRIIQLAFKIGF